MQQWESKDSRHSGVHWRSINIDTLQREAFVQYLWFFIIITSNVKDFFFFSSFCFSNEVGFSFNKPTKMDNWGDSFDSGDTVLVIMVPCSIKNREKVSMPVFKHCHNDILWSHTISYSGLSLWKEGLVYVGSQGKDANHHCSVFCKYKHLMLSQKQKKKKDGRVNLFFSPLIWLTIVI